MVHFSDACAWVPRSYARICTATTDVSTSAWSAKATSLSRTAEAAPAWAAAYCSRTVADQYSAQLNAE